MNKDIDREKTTQVVSSKYFTSKSAMDESLTDFQEPKKLAHTVTATRKTKPDKPKKAPKRIRGQKDIRTALKSKKNELESYSKDFDHVCKQAGLDVDSEQLQLAIALSKSLQQTPSQSDDSPETSQSLTSQERVGKIRTTLLEYGFKVPEIKITISRRLKRRKNYKLLHTDEEAKKQIIAHKYSQVLFKNVTRLNNSQNIINITDIPLYNLATNTTFSVLKNIDTFYVDGLLEKSSSTVNLLRDWSEIPGRPVSPKLFEPTNMNFSEIECSQDELDIVLSGSLKSCKNVIKSKEKLYSVSECKFSEQNEQVNTINLDNSVIVLIDNENPKPNEIQNDLEELKVADNTKMTDGEIIDLENSIATVNKWRSCSPDLFDDEPSEFFCDVNEPNQDNKSPSQEISKSVAAAVDNVTDLTECPHTVKENHSIYAFTNSLSKNTTKFNDFMEITECVDIQCVDVDSESKTFKVSQNVTKRKTNDLMEITNCIESPVQHINIEADVDLTQSSEPDKCLDENNAQNKTNSQNAVQNVIDEDKVHRNKTIPSKHSSNNDVLNVLEEYYIDLTENPVNSDVENIAVHRIENLDLTQSSNTSEELPFVSLKTNNKPRSADDTIILDPKDYEGIEKSTILQHNGKTQNITCDKINNSLQESGNNINSSQHEQNPNEILDLTQGIVVISKYDNKTSDANNSFFEDYIHNHSDNSEVHKEIACDSIFSKESSSKENVFMNVENDTSYNNIECPDVIRSASINLNAKQNKGDEIDLSQNSGSSEEISQSSHKDYSKLMQHSIESDENEAIIETKVGRCSQSDIDLTQDSLSEEITENLRHKEPSINVESDNDASVGMGLEDGSHKCSRKGLGRKDDISIDYDELYDNLISRHSDSQRSKNMSEDYDNVFNRHSDSQRSKNMSIDYDELYDNELSQQSDSPSKNSCKSAKDINISNIYNKSNDISNCSQDSEVFVISDNELDYSMHQSKLEKPTDNFQLGGLSIMDRLSIIASFRKSFIDERNKSAHSENIPPANNSEDEDSCSVEVNQIRTPVKHKRVNELATPQKPSCSGLNTVVTPNNSQYVIKTTDVTPMPKYDSMSLEDIHSELDKFGVKPFKRKRAIQLLTYIYNQTHPTVEPYSDEESPRKRRKTNENDSPRKLSPRKLTPRKILSPKKTAKSPRKVSKKGKETAKEKVKASKESTDRLNNQEIILISKNYEVDETPVVKQVECSPDDWVFQKREKAKVHSCRVPLHIAFNNYVSSRRGLQEAILCYEPINIDEVHKDLVAYGHRYDPKDLLKFMDKKCITVKTTDNDARNQRR